MLNEFVILIYVHLIFLWNSIASFVQNPKLLLLVSIQNPKRNSITNIKSIVGTNENNIDKEIKDGYTIVHKPSYHILLQSQSVCREIFSQDITVRPPNLGVGDLFERWLGKCMGCLDNRDSNWGKLKKIFKPLFDIKPDTDILIKKWNCTLEQLFEKTKLTEKPVSIEKVVDNLPLHFILGLIFGDSFVEKNLQTFELLRIDADYLMFQAFNNKYAKSISYRILPTETNHRLKRFNNNWNKIMRIADIKDCELYSMILKNYQKSDVPWDCFSQTLCEIVYANQDITIPSMSWLLTHYSLCPRVTNIGNFIEESARMTPVAKTSMPKITTKDMTICGELIKKGTVVIVDFVSLGFCSDWKMKDLKQFRPERFQELQSNDFISRFGYGSRRCPGHKLANTLFQAALQHLSTNWILMPKSPISINSIQCDHSKAFLAPLHQVWLRPISDKTNQSIIHYDCSPLAEQTELAYVGVSVNKRSPFLTNSELANHVIQYLVSRREKSVILICDTIAHFNIQAFEHYKPEMAITESLQLGNKFTNIFQDAIKKYGDEKMVKICRWNDMEQKVIPLKISASEYPDLNERIDVIADKFLTHRGQKKIASSRQIKINLIKQYILHEIPVLVNGIVFGGDHYRLLYYCGTQEHLTKFADDKESLHNLIMAIYNNPQYDGILNTLIESSGLSRHKVPGFIGIKA